MPYAVEYRVNTRTGDRHLRYGTADTFADAAQIRRELVTARNLWIDETRIVDVEPESLQWDLIMHRPTDADIPADVPTAAECAHSAAVDAWSDLIEEQHRLHPY